MDEKHYETDENTNMYIYWLQREERVNDQGFESYATCLRVSRDDFTMSLRRKMSNKQNVPETSPWKVDLQEETLVGAGVALICFIAQFFFSLAIGIMTVRLGRCPTMTLMQPYRSGYTLSGHTSSIDGNSS